MFARATARPRATPPAPSRARRPGARLARPRAGTRLSVFGSVPLRARIRSEPARQNLHKPLFMTPVGGPVIRARSIPPLYERMTKVIGMPSRSWCSRDAGVAFAAAQRPRVSGNTRRHHRSGAPASTARKRGDAGSGSGGDDGDGAPATAASSQREAAMPQPGRHRPAECGGDATARSTIAESRRRLVRRDGETAMTAIAPVTATTTATPTTTRRRRSSPRSHRLRRLGARARGRRRPRRRDRPARGPASREAQRLVRLEPIGTNGAPLGAPRSALWAPLFGPWGRPARPVPEADL